MLSKAYGGATGRWNTLRPSPYRRIKEATPREGQRMPIVCEGRFDFEEELLFHADALGSQVAAEIGGVQVEVFLPRPPIRADGISLDGGDLQAPSTKLIFKGRPGQGRSEWGAVWQLPSGLSYVHAAVLRVQVLPSDE